MVPAVLTLALAGGIGVTLITNGGGGKMALHNGSSLPIRLCFQYLSFSYSALHKKDNARKNRSLSFIAFA